MGEICSFGQGEGVGGASVDKGEGILFYFFSFFRFYYVCIYMSSWRG